MRFTQELKAKKKFRFLKQIRLFEKSGSLSLRRFSVNFVILFKVGKFL